MTLDEKARELRNAYQREYRRKHPEIRKKQLEYTRKWKQAHPENKKSTGADTGKRKRRRLLPKMKPRKER